jgi:ADP-ribosylglycohydrolase
MGHTTRTALSWADHYPDSPAPAQLCLAAAAAGSQGSKANGALMRASPLAVWGHGAADEQLVEWAALDAT